MKSTLNGCWHRNAEKRWDLKDMFLQFTSNQQIICIIIGILFCLIARACGGEIFEEI